MYDVRSLEKTANEIRRDIIKMLINAGSGHAAGPLGMADVFTALYFAVLNIDPDNPSDPERDRFFLSSGHINPVWYAVLARRGFFPLSKLSTLRKLGSELQGHPQKGSLPGIENSSGSLGQGFSCAAGSAYALLKILNKNSRVYCVMSDGEQQEGQVWEVAMFAGKNKLKNLTVLIDSNNIQISGNVDQVMPTEPLKAKYEAFNWKVLEIDGHDISEIVEACKEAGNSNRPTAIICRTVPGKGVDFMEYRHEWHGSTPNKDQAEEALRKLKTLGGRIKAEHE
jgi:transketolase